MADTSAFAERGAPALILASASTSRAALLAAVGIDVRIRPAAVDETIIKKRLRDENTGAEQVAMALAEAKARAISVQEPDALVIGADQMLECEGAWLDKPRDVADAGAQLRGLRGRRHRLISAVCVARSEEIVWRVVETATLTMRGFTDAFLEDYLALLGDTICETVGGYRIEGPGLHLFDRIEGDQATILGLPLLPLLAFLREQRVLRR